MDMILRMATADDQFIDEVDAVGEVLLNDWINQSRQDRASTGAWNYPDGCWAVVIQRIVKAGDDYAVADSKTLISDLVEVLSARPEVWGQVKARMEAR